MTGSAGRAHRFNTISSPLGGVQGGRARDDGKRLCDLDRARDVVFRLAPQDNSVGRGRSGGGMVPDRSAPDGWRIFVGGFL